MSNSFFNHTNRLVRFDSARAEDLNSLLDNVSSGLDGVEVKTNAAIKLPDGETAVALPAAGSRAGKLLGFNAVTGLPEAQSTIGENKGNWTTATAYGLRDIVKDASGTQNIYQCIVAHTSGTLATDITSGDWFLLVDATSAAASQASAVASAASAAAAQVSENSAATSATTAASYHNYKGIWSSLTGALAIPASVYHNGSMWILISSLADVTANQPGATADWVSAGGGSTAKTIFIASSF